MAANCEQHGTVNNSLDVIAATAWELPPAVVGLGVTN